MWSICLQVICGNFGELALWNVLGDYQYDLDHNKVSHLNMDLQSSLQNSSFNYTRRLCEEYMVERVFLNSKVLCEVFLWAILFEKWVQAPYITSSIMDRHPSVCEWIPSWTMMVLWTSTSLVDKLLVLDIEIDTLCSNILADMEAMWLSFGSRLILAWWSAWRSYLCGYGLASLWF